MARISRYSAIALPVELRVRARPQVAGERLIAALLLLIALVQGGLYLALVPPWQHYDEPTHFEYAWLIAQHGQIPTSNSLDQALRREVAASMVAHDFFRGIANPNSLKSGQGTWIGISELQHPPTYYLLASLPLRLARHLDVESQLYAARAISLLLFLLTIACAIGLMREITPPGHALRWAVPLALALLPPFVDLMTAVNNDVGVTAAVSLFLWGAARAIGRGLSWRRLAWVLGSAGLAAATKNTGAVALLFAVLAIALAWWRQRGWRWRWLLGLCAGVAVGIVLLSVGWGDAAAWYRQADVISQDAATRVDSIAAPVGPHALMLVTRADTFPASLTSPLLAEDAQRLAGHTVTIGAWVWADRPALVSAPALAFKQPGMLLAQLVAHPVQVTTTPKFVAWTFAVPEQAYYVSYMALAATPARGAAPVRLFLDGAVIAVGTYAADPPPHFDDATARAGEWGGQRFVNYVRNPSFEAGWPRLRPWVDQALIQYIHRTPAQLITTMIDLPRLQPVFVSAMLRPAIDGLVGSFAWGQVRLASPIWLWALYLVGVLALCGGVRWLITTYRHAPSSMRITVIFLLLVGLAIWGNTILRPLPLLNEQYVLPATRYTFPAIIVTLLALVGGWWALWPQKQRPYALGIFFFGLLLLNAISISTIWSFFN
jgi:4-amino-4-deoxy-L-arabinose transferase-like glycosyltransferase